MRYLSFKWNPFHSNTKSPSFRIFFTFWLLTLFFLAFIFLGYYKYLGARLFFLVISFSIFRSSLLFVSMFFLLFKISLDLSFISCNNFFVRIKDFFYVNTLSFLFIYLFYVNYVSVTIKLLNLFTYIVNLKKNLFWK
jgi:hypothetical protein